MDEIIILGIIILTVITIIFGSKKGNAYKKKLTPTMKFILAASSNTYTASECSSVDIGGNPADNWAKKHMRKMLKSGWNVRNAEDLNVTISWLFNEGHNVECMQFVEQYKMNPQSVKINKLFKKDRETARERFEIIATKYKDQGIIAWDLCRACTVAGWGFLARYITYEEAIKISVDACKILQRNYSSWDDMMESYFLGFWYWSNDEIRLHNRKGWYEHRDKEDSIYNVPWDTVLNPQDVIPPRR